MSTMHLCSPGGCETIHIVEPAMEAAERKRREFAVAYKQEHGEYPDLDLQCDTLMDEYEAVAQRRTMRVLP